jgi:hypothetical protein
MKYSNKLKNPYLPSKISLNSFIEKKEVEVEQERQRTAREEAAQEEEKRQRTAHFGRSES